MKRVLFLVALLVAASLPALAQTRPSQSARAVRDEQAVMELIREYDDARVKRDLTAMSRILADDFTSITPDGSLNTKAQFIATFTSPNSKLQAIERDEISIRFYEETAVLTSRAVLKMQLPEGRTVSPSQRSMMVLVKRQSRWQVVGSQGTFVRQPSPPNSPPPQ